MDNNLFNATDEQDINNLTGFQTIVMRVHDFHTASQWKLRQLQ